MHGEPTSPELEKALDYLRTLQEIITGTGEHSHHLQVQVGESVACSCGGIAIGKLVHST